MDVAQDIARIIHGKLDNASENVAPSASDATAALGPATSDATAAADQASRTSLSQTSTNTTGIWSWIDDFLRARKDVEEGGNLRGNINAAFAATLSFVAAATAVGYQLDCWYAQERLWICGMLLASYAILVLALAEILFSCVITFNLLGFHFTLTVSDEGASGPMSPSIVSLVGEMWKSDACSGALLVVLFAMVVPAFKLLLLCVGEIWRSSTDPSKVRGARLCIYTVQLVSKWACPDMFAYILLLYLLRSLGGDLVGSQVHLDMGFMHFSVFCICSTFSSLAIRLPARPPPEGSCRQSPQQAQQHRRRREEKALVAQLRFWLVAGLALLFLLCLGAGICTSCMSLRVDTSLLVKPTGPLPSWVQPVLTWLDVASQTASDVKLWQCVVSLCWWSLDEANCFLALLLLAVFALALPAANMVLLLCVSAGEVVSAVGSPPQPGYRKGYVSCASSAVHVLKHLSMLDVAITGIVVACLVTGVYKEQGIVLSMGPGLAYLVLAEAIHYATYHLVQCSVTTAPEEVAQPAATSEP